MSAKLPRRRIIISFAAILLAGLMLAWTYVQDDRQSAQIDALYAALGDEQSNAEAQGVDPVAPDPEDLLEDPEYTPAPGPSGPPGPGPSDSQVYDAIEAYYLENPNTGEPSPAEMTAYIANYLADHPPGPSKEQISAMLAEYLVANPPTPGADGEDGVDGEPGPEGPSGPPGPPVTPEELAAATLASVEEFMAENPLPPTCPEGYEFTAATLVTLDGPPLESVVCAAVAG